MPGPLSHLRVVDVTDIRGALASRILADLGADVVKVELDGGDLGRRRGPFANDVAEPDRALAFLYRNANKRGVVLPADGPAAAEQLQAFCGAADVLIENLERPSAAALGLEPAAIRAAHPRLVHVVMADFGLTGPRAGWRLEALPAFAASGALFASGFLDRPPCWLPGYAAHDCASLFAVVGALAAVLERARHGQGQTVDVSVQEAAIHALHPWSIPMADYARAYPVLRAVAPRNADGAYWVLPTADGYIRALPASPRQWKAFVELLGVETLADPEWTHSLYRLANADVIRLLAGEALRDRPRSRGARAGAGARRSARAAQSPGRVRRRRADAGARLLPADGLPARGRCALRRAAVQLECDPRAPRSTGTATGCERRRLRAAHHRGGGTVRRPAFGLEGDRPRRRRRRARDRLPAGRARCRGGEDRIAREPGLPAPRDGGARCAEPGMDVQRRVSRAEERLPRPPDGPRAGARARSLCRGRRRHREQPRRRRPALGPRLRIHPRAAAGRDLLRVAGVRSGWPARRGVGVRSAQLGLLRRHLALEPPGPAVSRRLLAESPGSHRRQARGRGHSGRARASAP